MGCCGKNADTAERERIAAMARDDKLAEGWIEMEYTGSFTAPVSFTSNETSTRYRGANGDRLPVHPKDVAWLEQRGWQKVEAKKVKQDSPELFIPSSGGQVLSKEGTAGAIAVAVRLLEPTPEAKEAMTALGIQSGQSPTSEETRSADLNMLFFDEEAYDNNDDGDDEAEEAEDATEKPKTRRRRKAADDSDDA